MNPVEVIATQFSAVMLGLLIENHMRWICTVIFTSFLTFQYHVNGTTISSIAVVVLAAFAPFVNCVFSKGHSDVEVCQEIEGDKCNIGRSLAINFLINYLDKILDELPEFLESYSLSVDQSNNSSHLERDAAPLCEGDQAVKPIVVKKLFLLIPKSGNNKYNTLTDADDKLQCIRSLKIKATNLSGHKGREYTDTIYQLEVEKSSKYHFMAEFATPLSSIFHVQNLPKINDKRAASDQVEIFYNSLVELLSKNKKKYGDIYCPLYYDDTCENEMHSLSAALRQELIKKVFEV